MKRCVSLRGNHRVGTALWLNVPSTGNSSDIQHTGARPGGRTLEPRRKNNAYTETQVGEKSYHAVHPDLHALNYGTDDIVVLAAKSTLDIIRTQHAVWETQVLKTCTGSPADLEAYRDAQYGSRCDPALGQDRPGARGQIGVDYRDATEGPRNIAARRAAVNNGAGPSG